MKNKGFSLVELIVVIAIMAILVGVAVPVYTSYIEKSQIAADEQLADEIKHAIEIGLIADKPDEFKGGVVVKLSATGATVTNGSAEDIAFVKGILEQTFGASWATELKLKHDGWKSGTAQTVMVNYAGSSFDGNEEALLGQIQDMTSALSGAIAANKTLVGSNFNNFLTTDLGLSNPTSDEAGNAAVLYVAKEMDGFLDDQTKADAFAEAWYQGNFSSLSADMGVAAEAAATYASWEAYFQYMVANATGDVAKKQANDALASWHKVDFIGSADFATDAMNSIYSQVETANAYLVDSQFETLRGAYFADGANSPAKNDAKAYLAALSAVYEASDLVTDNLGNADCYTNQTILGAVNSYIAVGTVGIQDGEMAIIINCKVDGTTDLTIFPIDVLN